MRAMLAESPAHFNRPLFLHRCLSLPIFQESPELLARKLQKRGFWQSPQVLKAHSCRSRPRICIWQNPDSLHCLQNPLHRLDAPWRWKSRHLLHRKLPKLPPCNPDRQRIGPRFNQNKILPSWHYHLAACITRPLHPKSNTLFRSSALSLRSFQKPPVKLTNHACQFEV